MLQTTPLSALSAPQMRAVHNLLAEERGLPLVSRRITDRALLGKSIALLRTVRPPSYEADPKKSKLSKAVADGRRNRTAPYRTVALEELARVSHFENMYTGATIPADAPDGYSGDEWLTIGFSYAEVARRVLIRLTGSKTSARHMRWVATMAFNGEDGFDCLLPDRRPHSAKGRSNAI